MGPLTTFVENTQQASLALGVALESVDTPLEDTIMGRIFLLP